METPSKTSSPLIAIAAIAVTLFSGVGIATMMGWMPNSHSKVPEPATLASVPATSGAPAGSEGAKPGLAMNAPTTGETAAVVPPSANTPDGRSNETASPPMHHHRMPAHRPAEAYGVPPPGSAPADSTTGGNNAQGVPPPGMGSTTAMDAAPTCSACGTVRSVVLVETKGSGSGLGAVAGGVLGAVVGHQVGSGNGNTLATLIGAGGGALAGNTVEQNVKKTSSWKVNVDMSDGSQRTFSFHDRPGYSSGDRVRISNGQLVSN